MDSKPYANYYALVVAMIFFFAEHEILMSILSVLSSVH